MIDQEEAIRSIGGEVLLVAYDAKEVLQAKIMRELPVPFPVVYDFKKESYRRWGMGRTSFARSVGSPRLTLRYLGLLLRGQRFLGFAKDMFQLGGDFVLDRDGRISFAHRMRDNGDRVSVPTLLEEMRKAADA